ncbi:cardioactive peptide isoform X3 [Anastrepha obliqua]|uniref:cardioactive peptide-like isoform X2 n=1 Tax=Anastrepha ludens TaxID=28586 RepID=UPI0023B06456|nr:cardioactive peptide-like isoform X2 [Anastrepha ludens]XP_054747610.1 cardioactive peptide isoform X3 [Anastrepha obliqua]
MLERNSTNAYMCVYHKLSGIIQWKYEKRPFCNAFTGCGKKRSSLPPYPLWKRAEMDEAKTYNNEEMSEGLSDLIDINAEPAVENVQKQIMSQAKIFEAIKEASKEIFRQKNKQKMRQREEVQDNTEGV